MFVKFELTFTWVFKAAYVCMSLLLLWRIYTGNFFSIERSSIYSGTKRVEVLLKDRVILTGALNVNGLQCSDEMWQRIPRVEFLASDSFPVDSKEPKRRHLSSSVDSKRGLAIQIDGIGIGHCSSLELSFLGEAKWKIIDATYSSSRLDIFIQRRLVLDWNRKNYWYGSDVGTSEQGVPY